MGIRLTGALTLAGLLLLFTLLPGAAFSADVPPGYTYTQLFDSGELSNLSDIAWAADGSMWIAQSGLAEGMRVLVVRNGVPLTALSLPGTLTGERGIHAIHPDPDYADNKRIWVYYTLFADPVRNRLSHFTNVNDQLVNETVVLEGPAVLSPSHNGGCLQFASDGTIFLGMGDDAVSSITAQNPFDLRGAISHIEPDGRPAAGNPYPDGVAGDPRVWSIGLRNPFRCRIQPGTGDLFVGDVGRKDWEEISIAPSGGNLGWSIVDGPGPPGLPQYVYPIHVYPHGPFGGAVIGGDFAQPGDLEPAYEGNYFFGDFVERNIRRVVLGPDNLPLSTEVWATDLGLIVDLEFGPDGALYHVSRFSPTAIGRIEFVGVPPTARAPAAFPEEPTRKAPSTGRPAAPPRSRR